MRKNEAHRLLLQLCPAVAEARGSKGRAVTLLESLCGDRGLVIGMCNQTGDWVVLNKRGAEVARTA